MIHIHVFCHTLDHRLHARGFTLHFADHLKSFVSATIILIVEIPATLVCCLSYFLSFLIGKTLDFICQLRLYLINICN